MKTYRILLAALAIVVVAQTSYATRSRTLERRIPASAEQRVEVSGVMGSRIVFRSWDRNEVYIRLSVSISSSDDRYEEAYVAGVGIDSSVTPGLVRLEFREPVGEERKGSWFSRLFGQFFVNKEISGEVYVPRTSALTSDMKYGTISLEGMAGAVELFGVSNALTLRDCAAVRRVENDYGTTRIEGCGGALQLKGSSSKVTVSDFTGSVVIDADYSTVSVERVSKDVSVTDQSGKVTVNEVAGATNVDAKYSVITIGRVKGAVTARSESGTVRLRDVGAADVQADYSTIDVTGVSGTAGKRIALKNQSGKISLEDATGDVSVDDAYSVIRLSRVRGNVSVTTSSGKVDAADITGDWKSHSDYSNVTVRGLSAATVNVVNSGSPVRLSLRMVPTTLAVRNSYSGVRISLPEGYTGEVDLDAQYGEIDTNLPVRNRNRNGSATATGRIGSGGGTISIETSSGNIDLQERADAGAAD